MVMEQKNPKEYLIEQGLGILFEMEQQSVVSGNNPIKINSTDLARIHQLIIRRRPFTTLEFGTGFSTLVIAHALQMNKKAYEMSTNKPALKNPPSFTHYSVDANQFWLDNTKKMLPSELHEMVFFCHSACEVKLFNGQLSHQYTQLPDIDPQFIYLDGPDPKDVTGQINGLSFSAQSRTVMSSDLLMMESIFTPGVFILVDGRTNNARFLERNFQRSYELNHYAESDVTTFELKEAYLGKRNEDLNFRY
jgi:hypothetical protein